MWSSTSLRLAECLPTFGLTCLPGRNCFDRCDPTFLPTHLAGRPKNTFPIPPPRTASNAFQPACSATPPAVIFLPLYMSSPTSHAVATTVAANIPQGGPQGVMLAATPTTAVVTNLPILLNDQ